MMPSLTLLNHHDASTIVTLLDRDFHFFSTTPGKFYDSEAALSCSIPRLPVTVPATLAASINEAQAQAELDNQDHWYINYFAGLANCDRVLLRFDGLLTYAEVYLNHQLLFTSTNAYHSHEIDVTEQLEPQNILCICFRAIRPVYRARHPRASYITRLVNERHLRFLRTPVLGYTPGFSSPAKPVGPYRPIRIIGLHRFHVKALKVETYLSQQCLGTGYVTMDVDVFGALPPSAQLVMRDQDGCTLVQQDVLLRQKSDQTLYVECKFNHQVAPYWPHTHGIPVRYSLDLCFETGESIALGLYGFRRIEPIAQERFMLSVNGEAIFLRGACWTPIDPIGLHVDKEKLYQRLNLLKEAGFNMLRIPGNMLYESDDFYALCDELGILIFQDFAFTNFEYPLAQDFLESVLEEVSQFLHKHGWRPCLAALCGGSEVAQQAVMMGLHIDDTKHQLFTKYIPETIKAYSTQLTYVVSSPYSSAGLPFHTGDGPCTYFGVGGYLRSFEDARLFKGMFITECLPFSHVPEDESLRRFWQGEIPPSHHPLWKEGVTRDPGSGWDFADVTDYYLQTLFELDPVKLRSISQDRYLKFCRATVAAVVEITMSIIRAGSAQGRAALVWLLQDLKPGAGWGYIDILGQPKSSFYALRRTFQPTTMLFVDEGLDGLAVYTAHDGSQDVDMQLQINLVTAQGDIFATFTKPLTLVARSVVRHAIDALAGHFLDSSYAYRFGPSAFAACVATLCDQAGNILTRKVYVSPKQMQHEVHDLGLKVQARLTAQGVYQMTVATDRPAYYIALEIPGFELSDNYFHVIPGFEHTVFATSKDSANDIHGRVRALNTTKVVSIVTRDA